MEYLDIVDENGIPTGKTISRELAHRDGILHRTAHVWVIRPSGEGYDVLLQKRSMEKESFPGFYDTSSAGHIPAGEEPVSSALRELQEELGIAAAPEQLRYAGSFRIRYEKEFHGHLFRDNEVTTVYVYSEPVQISSLVLQESEVDEVRWFGLDEVWNEIHRSRERFCVPTGGLQVLREYLGYPLAQTQRVIRNSGTAGVTLQVSDDFDLDKIAESGQCFRWTKTDRNTYRIIAGRSCLYITALGENRYDLSCTEDEYNRFWLDYFDFRENYHLIRDRIDQKQDPFLWRAAECQKGIRILRQDPWEMLITSIITQNRNIPAIRRSVELLSRRCGEKKTDPRGADYYTFPEPEAILALAEDELLACKLGYRWKYVHAAAAAVVRGETDLDSLAEAEESRTISELTRLFGVGVKVANCVSLFGLHHLDAFPVDVWMKRILEQEYPDGYPFEAYSPYNGIYQQYMFAFYRQRDEQIQQ